LYCRYCNHGSGKHGEEDLFGHVVKPVGALDEETDGVKKEERRSRYRETDQGVVETLVIGGISQI